MCLHLWSMAERWTTNSFYDLDMLSKGPRFDPEQVRIFFHLGFWRAKRQSFLLRNSTDQKNPTFESTVACLIKKTVFRYPACRYGRVQKFWSEVKPCYDVGSGRVPMLFPTNREISDGTPSVCHTTVIRAGLCESCSSSKIGKIAALEGSKWMALILFLAKCHHKR